MTRTIKGKKMKKTRSHFLHPKFLSLVICNSLRSMTSHDKVKSFFPFCTICITSVTLLPLSSYASFRRKNNNWTSSFFLEYDKFYPVKVYNNSQASNQVECALLTSILMGDGQQRSNPEKEIIANSFRFTTMGSICESGVVPFFSGDYDDKPPITAPNGAIHVAYGRVAKSRCFQLNLDLVW